MAKIILRIGMGSTGKTTLANQLVKVLDEDYIIDGFDLEFMLSEIIRKSKEGQNIIFDYVHPMVILLSLRQNYL